MITLRNGEQYPQTHLWLARGRVSFANYAPGSNLDASVVDHGYLLAARAGVVAVTRDDSGTWGQVYA